LARLNRFTPAETIRATVVGAGSHITEISGSTIEYDQALLPLKNVPILKLNEQEASPQRLADAIRGKLDWFAVDGELSQVAIAFAGPEHPSFAIIEALADALVLGTAALRSAGLPLIIVVETDIAKVLGQSIRLRLPSGALFCCIDDIQVSSGDYIDIGTPAVGGSILPVVVKTLLFK
jgi:ethanolamine utilization protein EutA